MGYPSFCGRVGQRTANRLQFAFRRLHPTRTVCGQHAKYFSCPSTSQNRVSTGAQKVLSLDHPILFASYQGTSPSELSAKNVKNTPFRSLFTPSCATFFVTRTTAFCAMNLSRAEREMAPRKTISPRPRTEDPAIGIRQPASWPYVIRPHCAPHKHPIRR